MRPHEWGDKMAINFDPCCELFRLDGFSCSKQQTLALRKNITVEHAVVNRFLDMMRLNRFDLF